MKALCAVSKHHAAHSTKQEYRAMKRGQRKYLDRLIKEYADAEAVKYWEQDQGWGKSVSEAKQAAEEAKTALTNYLDKLTERE